MERLVVKFGGSSLSSVKKINRVCEKIIKLRKNFNELVVVVSAMGKTTDKLLKQASEVAQNPDPEILDKFLNLGELKSVYLMGVCLRGKGLGVAVLNGSEAGITTQGNFGNSFIKNINTDAILNEFKAGNIVVVAGFCGANVENKITTLGRGGSDTTAVALASALKCKCKIFTDVSHVYTIDPRVEPRARKIQRLNLDDALEFCACGAKVLDIRCVEVAKKFETPLSLEISNSKKRKNDRKDMKNAKKITHVGLNEGLDFNKNGDSGTEIVSSNFESLQVVGLGVEEDFALYELSVDRLLLDNVLKETMLGLKKLKCFEVKIDKNICKIKFACGCEKVQIIAEKLKNFAKNIDYYPNVCLLNIVGVGFCTHNEDVFNIISLLLRAGVGLRAVQLGERVLTLAVGQLDKEMAVKIIANNCGLIEE